MESKEQGERIRVKESIKYICVLIAELGVTGLTPENLRLAKFNKLESPRCLLRALHDLVALYIACFPVETTCGKSKTSTFLSCSSTLPHDSASNSDRKPIHMPIPPALCSAPPRRTELGQRIMHNSISKSEYFDKTSATVSVKNVHGQKIKATTPHRVQANPNYAWPREPEREGNDLAPKGIAANLGNVCESSPDLDTLAFVKFYLALWGYPPHSPFFTLSADTHESRHFLLALGWLISHCNVVEKGLERRLQPMQATRNVAILSHAYPPDTCSDSEALAKAREAECSAYDYVKRMVAASGKIEDENVQVEMLADQALMLYGQVRACLNAIEALQVSKVNRLHDLQLAQLAAGLGKPHSQFELHLLQHREKLDLHYKALMAAKATEEEKEVCERHEGFFWQWMESVAQEALNEQANTNTSPKLLPPPIELAGVANSELHPVIAFLKQKSMAVSENVLEDETSPFSAESGICLPFQDEFMEMLPTTSQSSSRAASVVGALLTVKDSLPRQAGTDIAHGLLKEPVFVYKPVKKNQDDRPFRPGAQHEEKKDTESALFKIKRLTDVNEVVKRVLAKARAENRTVIREILKPFMEDDAFVVVGL